MLSTYRIEASAIAKAFVTTAAYLGTIAGFMMQVAQAAGYSV